MKQDIDLGYTYSNVPNMYFSFINFSRITIDHNSSFIVFYTYIRFKSKIIQYIWILFRKIKLV